jgi:hypothetical protein
MENLQGFYNVDRALLRSPFAIGVQQCEAKTRIGISIPKTHLSSRTGALVSCSHEKGRGVGLCPGTADSVFGKDVLEGLLF